MTMCLKAPASGQEIINAINNKATKAEVNNIVKMAYTSGVVQESENSLKVNMGDLKSVCVNCGTAFFADGTSYCVGTDEQLAYQEGGLNYVYITSDGLRCTQEEPTGEFVSLAEISDDCILTDKRVYVESKIPLCDGSLEAKVYFSFAEGETQASFTVDLGTNNYSRVFVISKDGNYGGIGMYNFSDGSYFSTYNVGYRAFWYASSEDIVVIPGYAKGGSAVMGHLTLSKSGNIMTGSFAHGDNQSASYSFTMVFVQESKQAEVVYK